MKVAIVHDYIKEYGGAERVLEALHEIWPTTPVYTSVYLPEFLGPHQRRFKDWKIITFDMLLPLDMVGWIAKVSDILADEGISILILSAYSTDHVLVKTSDLEKATTKLRSMGCRISEK